LYVYLYLSIENLQRNIQKRGRNYEKSIKNEYLEKIQSGYFSYFTQEKDRTFLIIDTNNIDFVNNPQDYNRLIDTIFNHKYEKGVNRVIL